MSTAEIAGVVDLGQWTPVPGGFEILLEPTSKIRRFHVRIRPKPPRESKVKHRRLASRLTDGEKSGM